MGDLESKFTSQTELSRILRDRGGIYRGKTEGNDTSLFNIYTNVELEGVVADRYCISVAMTIDTPPGEARSPDYQVRIDYWKNVGSKRLIPGGLVAFIWQKDESDDIAVYVGTIASSHRDITESAIHDSGRISIRVGFYDPAVEAIIIREFGQGHKAGSHGIRLIIEATVMYEAIRPVLEALTVEPTSIPFSRYLTARPPGELASVLVEPPIYAKKAGHRFQLASLCPNGPSSLELSVTDPDSVRQAQEILEEKSRLDPSQVNALIDALTHEVSLIQG